MSSSFVRRRVVARGRVQGVFFRDMCRREAEARTVSGWVLNRGDGAVEAIFEGPDEDVEALVEWAREGPALARVESVEVVDEPIKGTKGFEIR